MGLASVFAYEILVAKSLLGRRRDPVPTLPLWWAESNFVHRRDTVGSAAGRNVALRWDQNTGIYPAVHVGRISMSEWRPSLHSLHSKTIRHPAMGLAAQLPRQLLRVIAVGASNGRPFSELNSVANIV